MPNCFGDSSEASMEWVSLSVIVTQVGEVFQGGDFAGFIIRVWMLDAKSRGQGKFLTSSQGLEPKQSLMKRLVSASSPGLVHSGGTR